MSEEIMDENKDKFKKETKKRQRSPAYPSCSLKECVQYIGLLYKKDGIAEVPRELAIQHMGLDPKKNDTYRATSSITGFGLLEEKGPITNRVFLLTNTGKIIVLTKEMTAQKQKALSDAAFNYDIIKGLYEKWPSGLPADDVIRVELILRGFTERVASRFISILRETYEFALLDQLKTISEKPEEEKLGDWEIPDESEKLIKPPSLMNYEEYILTLSKGKEIKLYILGNLTKDDIDFMMQWIKRLDLKGSKQPEQLSFIEKESEIEDEKEPDVPF